MMRAALGTLIGALMLFGLGALAAGVAELLRRLRWPWDVSVLTCRCGHQEPVEWPCGVSRLEWRCGCGAGGLVIRGAGRD